MARDEFARRRRQLMRLMGRDSIAILPAAPVRMRNNDVEYAYRQDSDFHYLTGFARAGVGGGADAGPRRRPSTCCSCAIAIRSARPGTAGAPVPTARAATTAPTMPSRSATSTRSCPDCSRTARGCYYTMGTYPEFDQRVVGWVNGLRTQARNGRHPPQEFVALDHVLHDMRLFKSRAELDLMRTAARIAARRHMRAMRSAGPGPPSTR